MNSNAPGQHYRGPSNPAGMNHGHRPGYDMRAGHMSQGGQPSPGMTSRFPPSATMSRAEVFEDEKKRIVESCFNKADTDGSSNESYITHIRVNEDEDYPSSPAPLSQPPSKKKPRVIMVAVRRSGRVRMHKGRENGNGSFSIGKTWNLDDLQKIESFTNMIPRSAEQQEEKERAQDTGFVVTMQKPYYWQAATAKEKDFFIFSLIKIYRKYTNGKLPELSGFSSQELDQLGGPATAAGSAPQARVQPNGTPPMPSSRTQAPSQDPSARTRGPDRRPSETPQMTPDTPRQPSEMPRRPSNSPYGRRKPSQDSQGSQPQGSERGFHSAQNSEHRAMHSASSRERSLRHGVSNERMKLPGGFPSTDSIPSQATTGHRSKRSGSPSSQRTMGTSAAASSRAPSEPRYGLPSSLEPGLPSAPNASPSIHSSDQPRLNGYASESRLRGAAQQRPDVSEERPRTASKDSDVPPALSIRSPKHRRPSIPTDSTSRSGSGDANIPPSLRAMESRNGSFQTARSDQDSESTLASSLIKGRASKPRSRDATERPPQSRFPGPVVSKEEIASAKLAEPDASPSLPPPEPQVDPEQKAKTEAETHRPGLGPMIKKKGDVAAKFRKAATAYNAFKPRSTAAENATTSPKEEPTGDGITGVFQAPSLLRSNTEDSVQPGTPAIKVDSRPATPNAKVSAPSSDSTLSPSKKVALSAPDASAKDFLAPAEQAPPSVPPIPAQDERRKKRRSDHAARYAKTLGIGSGILEGRTLEIEAVLSDFGWGEEDNNATFEELESGIRRELARVEAGSWLGAVDSGDDRTAALDDMMDKVLAECEELDCLLTLYNVELGSLSEDVAYIEAQSQGLQVQTANQKLLHTELRNLLDIISISSQQLIVLKEASLTKTRGIREVESTLSQLFSAMITIDPKLRSGGDRLGSSDQASLHRRSHSGYTTSDLSSMNAVREKEYLYRRECREFVTRLKQYISVKFRETEAQTLDALDDARQTYLPKGQIKDTMREKPRSGLWLYRPLILFTREIEPAEWSEILRQYEASAKKPYIDEFRENIAACKRTAKKPTGDESEVLFTHQEKETESLGRKLTVKRTKTVRNDGSSRLAGGARVRDDQPTPYEAFAQVLTDECRVICMEQNFVVDFFHLSALANEDFFDAIKVDPDARRGTNLLAMKSYDPDRNFARKIQVAMEEIFGFWAMEIQGMLEWAIKQDQLNGVGMLCALESQMAILEDTNQEFLVGALTPMHDRLMTKLTRTIEEQVRGIEDTKVKIKKRKGLISFMKTFPHFVAAVESTLPPDPRLVNHLLIRTAINDSYNDINKAMFESLKFIAKELPHGAANSGPGGASSGAAASTTASSLASANTSNDPEDKEALNYHILLIENMHHYIDEVVPRGNPILEEWVQRARAEFDEHLALYLSATIRRPLGKLLDFLESTETLLHALSTSSGAGAGATPTTAMNSPTSIAQRPSHSKHVAKKVLGQYDAKEIRRGIETLKKRVEKHFGEADGGQMLLDLVLQGAEREYLGVVERVARVGKEVYEGEVEVGWGKGDVQSGFRR